MIIARAPATVRTPASATRSIGGMLMVALLCAGATAPISSVDCEGEVRSIGLDRCGAQPEARPITLPARTRDPHTHVIVDRTERIDAARVGVVVIDMWNWHWCMTASQRVGAMVPRMNAALAGARELGMTIFWAPTDVASQYVGTPPRERAAALPIIERPTDGQPVHCRWTFPRTSCMCGPGFRCGHNYGWDAMHDALRIDMQRDGIVGDGDELYAACQRRGITHLIYAGVHTNVCVVGKTGAMLEMSRAGLTCLLARDLTDASGGYRPGEFTPDDSTAHAVADVERGRIATVDMVELLRVNGRWDDEAITEMVRFSPWGATDRPYLFTDRHVVTLSAPGLEGVTIRYTLDGSASTASSAAYDEPIALTETTHIRAAAFRGDRRVSLASEGYYVRRPSDPPKADVPIDTLDAIPERYAEAGRTTAQCFWAVRKGKAYDGRKLTIGGRTYSSGLGMRARSAAEYAIAPSYQRFVALVGADDNIVGDNHKHMLARHPSVVFKVYIDGALKAESPVMRVQQSGWPIDVSIPRGARRIRLVLTDAGSPSAYDLGDWVSAGFITEERP